MTRTKRQPKEPGYVDLLKDPRWQKKRLEIMERDRWACVSCQSTNKTLTVHHGLYRWGVAPWDLPSDTMWTLCEECHQRAQDRLADLKLEIGRLSPADYEDAIHAVLYIESGGKITYDPEGVG